MTLPRVFDSSPYLGCDPEFFFQLDGATIGAEKIIPKDGMVNTTPSVNDRCVLPGSTSKFIIDGVQAELNPRPNTCRANLANEISACFKTLKAELAKQNKGIKVDFSRTVEISEENLMQLNEDSRKFGCAPSQSIYKKTAGVRIDTIDPAKYRVRAAGGHIHIGKSDSDYIKKAFLPENHANTVALLDLICGNTCVLIDRDESNIERRKLYGKAGEFRVPPHGLEYRTLSNFWLTSYPLMSLAFGLARLAIQLSADLNNSKAYFDAFTSKVKPKDVKAAINKNNFELAMTNFKAIESLLLEVTSGTDRYPFHTSNIKEFHHFIEMVNKNGMGYWFKDDPIVHWTTLEEAHRGGFFDYLNGVVRADMTKQVSLAQPDRAPAF